MRDHATGGGAVQDALTHLVNAMEWIIGPCTRVFCDASHQALEGVSVEDTVNVSARHGGVLVSYAMNQFQAPNETRLPVHCERGSVKIESHAQTLGRAAARRERLGVAPDAARWSGTISSSPRRTPSSTAWRAGRHRSAPSRRRCRR